MKLHLFFVVALIAGASARASWYISDGDPIDNIDDASFMLSLRQGSNHICGAVLIKARWGLTTADCVIDKTTGYPKPKLTVRAGSLQRNAGGYIQKFSKLKIHPNYNAANGEYNFALFQVAGAFPDNCKPPRLASCYTEPETMLSATVYGWGKTDEYGQFADTLQIGELYIHDRSTCNSIPLWNRQETTHNAKLLCAASSGVATCAGDEGGPLMVDDLLVGISTYRKGCADPFNPSVFGNIGNVNVRRWIDQTAS